MILFFNPLIPFPGFSMMMLLGVCFIRDDRWRIEFGTEAPGIRPKSLNHERIHAFQQWEALVLTWAVMVILGACGVPITWWMVVAGSVFSFYIWYLISWIIQILVPPYDTAYGNICFEDEAYENEDNLDYLKTRRPFAWVWYIFNGKGPKPAV